MVSCFNFEFFFPIARQQNEQVKRHALTHISKNHLNKFLSTTKQSLKNAYGFFSLSPKCECNEKFGGENERLSGEVGGTLNPSGGGWRPLIWNEGRMRA